MDEIKELIKSSGLKKKFIAAKLGIHPAYLSQVLSGSVPLTERLKERIINLLSQE